MTKLIFSLSLVVIGIALGYFIQKLTASGTIKVKDGNLGPIRKKLQQVALLVLNPIAVIGASWVANLQDLQIISLPFLCLIALFSGGTLAFILSKLFRMENRQTGAYVVCGAFTNIGSLGALFCFMFLGEPGFALMPLYKLFEEFSYYAFGFPMAKSFSLKKDENETFTQRLRIVFKDIFIITIVTAMVIGFGLNFSGIERPDFYGTLNSVLIPTFAFMLLVSIGMGMKFSSVKKYFKQSLCIAFIKFCCVPLLIGSLGYLFGLHTIDNGLPLKVVIILSSMPTGFIAMIPPTLYNLDVDLANSCWLTTNILLLLQIPLLLFIINLF